MHACHTKQMASLFLLGIWFLVGQAAALSTTYYREAASARATLLRVVEEEVSPGQFVAETAESGRRIAQAVEQLELSGEAPLFPRDLEVLQGVWRLKYTNNAPPPLPRQLRDVIPSFGSTTSAYQKINIWGRRVVNIVCVGPPVDESLGETLLKRVPIVGQPLAKASVRLDLEHSFVVEGEDRSRQLASTNRLAISLERVKRTLVGASWDELPSLLRESILAKTLDVDVPAPAVAVNSVLNTFAGKFDTTYCDSEIRISRGITPLGQRELRVFVKCDDADIPVSLEGEVVAPPPVAEPPVGEEASSWTSADEELVPSD